MVAAAWMLDTHVLSELIRDPRGALASRVIAEPAGAVRTSIIVACELRIGAARNGSPVLLERVDPLLDRVDLLLVDADMDRHYADVRSALERAGTPIGSHDLFIAAHARCLDLTVVTRNQREFARAAGLRATICWAANARCSAIHSVHCARRHGPRFRGADRPATWFVSADSSHRHRSQYANRDTHHLGAIKDTHRLRERKDL